ncbi:hypothetical protein [Morganella morganii IS15]|nr:hypothetical protein CSB69_0266 [Morganella morganii]EMP52147.1 hypothetical protein C790_00617 [Morganella morganii SC01]CDK65141.1 hypothetical protein [Morganella morganii IS15]
MTHSAAALFINTLISLKLKKMPDWHDACLFPDYSNQRTAAPECRM